MCSKIVLAKRMSAEEEPLKMSSSLVAVRPAVSEKRNGCPSSDGYRRLIQMTHIEAAETIGSEVR